MRWTELSPPTGTAHEEETSRLLADLEGARTSVAAAEARADAADQRAARRESARQQLASQAAKTDKAIEQLQVDLAKAEAIG